MKTLKLGVVGYCPPTVFDENKALMYIKQGYDAAVQDFPDHEITVVSGLTNVGVLRLAYEEARRRGWKTAGIASEKAYDYKDNWFPVDEEPVIVGEDWGGESETFTDSIDALVRIGSGPQSLREAEVVANSGRTVYAFELPKIE